MANGNHGPLYTMLETIREYASMQLEASGEGTAVRDRHAAYFVQVSEQAESNLLGPHGSTWLDHLDQERDNLRAALKWMSASGTAMLPRLAGSLWRYWYARGDLMEGCDWLSIALAVDKKSSAGAKCITGAALLEHCLGNEEVALAYGEASPAFYQANGDRFGTAITLYVLGKIAEDNGEYDQAHNRFNEASTLFSLDDEQAWAGLALDHLGSVAYGRGDYEEASTVLTTALELQRMTGHRYGAAVSLLYLGHIALTEGNHVAAARCYGESLVLWREEKLRPGIVEVLSGLAAVAANRGNLEQATRLFGAADKVRNAIGLLTRLPERTLYERDTARARRGLGESDFQKAWAAGVAMSLDQAMAEAAAIASESATLGRTLATSEPAPNGLTRPEMDVLQLIAAGHSNQEIADTLFISLRTVANHVTNILAKLGVKSSRAAAAAAHRLGIA